MDDAAPAVIDGQTVDGHNVDDEAPVDVAAVVVNFNTAADLRRCLSSLRREQVERIVVVDNGSRDDSKEVAEAAGVLWVASGGNVGYGRAANMGARHPEIASRPLLLVCNPDIELRPGAVADLRRTLLRNSRLGVVGPRLVNPDGSLYPSARAFPSLLDAAGHALVGLIVADNPFTRRYRMIDWDHSEAALVDWVSGACFLVRRDAWVQVDGFDPAYFMYMEDVDLCWRLGGVGWQVAYEPRAVVEHTQGVAADMHPYRMLLAHHRSMWIFALRSTTGRVRVLLPVILAGLGARAAVALLRRFLAGARKGLAGRRPLDRLT